MAVAVPSTVFFFALVVAVRCECSVAVFAHVSVPLPIHEPGAEDGLIEAYFKAKRSGYKDLRDVALSRYETLKENALISLKYALATKKTLFLSVTADVLNSFRNVEKKEKKKEKIPRCWN